MRATSALPASSLLEKVVDVNIRELEDDDDSLIFVFETVPTMLLKSSRELIELRGRTRHVVFADIDASGSKWESPSAKLLLIEFAGVIRESVFTISVVAPGDRQAHFLGWRGRLVRNRLPLVIEQTGDLVRRKCKLSLADDGVLISTTPVVCWPVLVELVRGRRLERVQEIECLAEIALAAFVLTNKTCDPIYVYPAGVDNIAVVRYTESFQLHLTSPAKRKSM